MRYFLLLVLFFSCTFFAGAQSSFFTINIGTFVNAKSEDFGRLNELGLLYAHQQPEADYIQVFLGGFEDRAKADQVLNQVKAAGYSGAYVQEVLLTPGQTYTVIQVANLKADGSVNWEKYKGLGDIYAIASGGYVKVVKGVYPDISAAKKDLEDIRKKGFDDAFIKKVNPAMLRKLGRFETGSALKEPLISIDLDNPSASREGGVPDSYSTTTGNLGTKSGAGPTIRSNVKRRSVLELQKVLKTSGYYEGSLDGYYGPATEQAFQQFVAEHPGFQKYKALAEVMPGGVPTTINDDPMQEALDKLVEDPASITTVERYNNAVSKGYQAYMLFRDFGPSQDVNNLMNTAIREAFAGQPSSNLPPFDPNATYAYNDMGQLILHLHFLHASPIEPYAAPCWLTEEHPQETKQARTTFSKYPNSGLKVQPCGSFQDWSESEILMTISRELSAQPDVDPVKLSNYAAERASLLSSPEPLDNMRAKIATDWNNKLWNNLNGWATRDPLNGRIVESLKVGYYQTLIRMEDHFMTLGLSADEAKVKSLEVMRTMVAPYAERFTK